MKWSNPYIREAEVGSVLAGGGPGLPRVVPSTWEGQKLNPRAGEYCLPAICVNAELSDMHKEVFGAYFSGSYKHLKWVFVSFNCLKNP